MSKTTTQERRMNTTHVIDMGWGDWRVADNQHTRVTVAQVETLGRLADVESIGASDVRFGDETGELCAFHTDGHVSEIGEDGNYKTFSE